MSDIHGNLPALEAVLNDMQEFDVDEVIIAGDTILGPHSEQVLDCLVDNKWLAIKGNYEINMLDNGKFIYEANRIGQDEYPIPAWLNDIVPDSLKAIINEWPDKLSLKHSGAPAICVVHGSPRSAWEAIYPTTTDEEIDEMLEGVAEPVVITGHTHLVLDRKIKRWHVLNPGSVGLPVNGKFEASYLLLEMKDQFWKPIFRQVPIDNTSVLCEFEKKGFVEKCGVAGRLFVETFKTARPQGGFLKWRKSRYPTESLSEEMLDEYYNSCEWWEYAHPAYRINL